MKYLLALLFLPIQLLATNYYVSNSGSDTNPGTLAQPWATITKVNSFMANINPGDSILFQRGGSFFGGIILGKSGNASLRIVIGAYGTGANPVINTSYTLTGWINLGNNIWEASVNTQKTNLNLVTIDGELQRMGRYPNYDALQDGWLSYSGTIDGTQFSQFKVPIPFTQNWVGGIVVARKSNYLYDLCKVISQPTSTEMTIENPPSFYGGFTPTDYNGYGYFIQNHPSTLDQQNEWYYNGTTKKLRMYSTSDPSARVIKMATWDTLVNLGLFQYITLDNLTFQYSNNFGVYSDNQHNNIQNCTFQYINAYVVDFEKDNCNFKNNLVRDCQGRGIYLWGSGDVWDNTIKNLGVLEGMGQSSYDSQQAIALKSENGNNTALRNVVDSIGFNGIRFEGSNKLIQNNYIQNCCLAQNDGGGIYTYATGLNSIQFIRSNQIVRKNIVVNFGRCIWGVPSTQRCISNPIYMDGQSNNVLIDSNFAGLSVSGQNANADQNNVSAFQGINNTFLTIRANVFFGFPNSLCFFDFGGNLVTNNNNRIVSNCFYVNKTASNLPNFQQNNCLQYITLRSNGNQNFQQQLTNLGYLDSNYISNYTPAPFDWYSTNPFSDPPSMKLDPISPSFPSPQWRLYTSHDLLSREIADKVPEIQYNPTGVATIYDFSGRQKKDYKDNIYNNSAIIPPYSGNIFFDNGAAQGTSLAVFSTATQINCFGGNSTVTVSATGGTPPYIGTGNFTRAAGTWTFTVTDAASNSIPTTITITQPPALTATSSKVDIDCGGTNTGSINVFPIGGTPPFTYSWNDGANTQNRTNLASATYSCIVTDSKGCTTTTSQTINQNAPLSASNPTAPSILVNGGTTTITQPIPTGGKQPYQYQLNTGAFQSSNIFSNVPAGSYVITIKDGVNCTITKNITITQPIVFTASASITSPILCYGGAASVSVTATGGTSPYSGTGTFTNLSPGNYVYTVTDASSNTASASITITQPTELVASATAGAITTVGGTTNVVVSATGGTPPYTGTGTFTRQAGVHQFTVQDGNGCINIVTISLSNPILLPPQFFRTTKLFRNFL